MKKRPLFVTVAAWLFIAAGTIGIVYHFGELNFHNLFAGDAVLLLIIRLLAVIGGIAVLRGANWGRWLVTAWMAFHLAVSLTQTAREAVMHGVLLVLVIFLLFNRKAAAYFKSISSAGN